MLNHPVGKDQKAGVGRVVSPPNSSTACASPTELSFRGVLRRKKLARPPTAPGTYVFLERGCPQVRPLCVVGLSLRELGVDTAPRRHACELGHKAFPEERSRTQAIVSKLVPIAVSVCRFRVCKCPQGGGNGVTAAVLSVCRSVELVCEVGESAGLRSC